MKPQNFPGDSECEFGMVTNIDSFGTHVCQKCMGHGCPPKRTNRATRARRAELLRLLSGSTVLTDQKGRTVYVDVERGTCHVMDT